MVCVFVWLRYLFVLFFVLGQFCECFYFFFFFQAEDGIRDLVRSRGLGDVYKRQGDFPAMLASTLSRPRCGIPMHTSSRCSSAAAERLSLIHI